MPELLTILLLSGTMLWGLMSYDRLHAEQCSEIQARHPTLTLKDCP